MLMWRGTATLAMALEVTAVSSLTRTLQAQDTPEGYLSLAEAARIEPVLRRDIDVSVTAISLAEALRRVTAAAGIDFVWEARLPALARIVSLQANRIRAAEAVTALIERSGAGHEIEVVVSPPATLIVRGRPTPNDSTGQAGLFAGYVQSAATGEPVAGAYVRLEGAAQRSWDDAVAWSDAAGRSSCAGCPQGTTLYSSDVSASRRSTYRAFVWAE